MLAGKTSEKRRVTCQKQRCACISIQRDGRKTKGNDRYLTRLFFGSGSSVRGLLLGLRGGVCGGLGLARRFLFMVRGRGSVLVMHGRLLVLLLLVVLRHLLMLVLSIFMVGLQY